MTDRCTIYEPPAATASDKGQAPDADYPDDWTVIKANLPCQYVPTQRASKEDAAIGQAQSITDARLDLPHDTPDFGANCRIRVIKLNGSTATLDLDVIGAMDRTHKVKTSVDVIKTGSGDRRT